MLVLQRALPEGRVPRRRRVVLGCLSSWSRWAVCVSVLCSSEYPLQHAATHCDTLQHTATHCNTLRHTATHCNTVQHSATHCDTLRHTATHYNTLQHTTTHCNTLQHTATHCNTKCMTWFAKCDTEGPRLHTEWNFFNHMTSSHTLWTLCVQSCKSEKLQFRRQSFFETGENEIQ